MQPRYILPLMTLLALVMLLRVRDDRRTLTRPQLALLAVALAGANSFALHTNIRRYVTGSDVWEWTSIPAGNGGGALPLTPMAVWIVGSVAFAAALVVVARRLIERQEQPVCEPAAAL